MVDITLILNIGGTYSTEAWVENSKAFGRFIPKAFQEVFSIGFQKVFPTNFQNIFSKGLWKVFPVGF
jgi:hypothetical protein